MELRPGRERPAVSRVKARLARFEELNSVNYRSMPGNEHSTEVAVTGRQKVVKSTCVNPCGDRVRSTT
ncbi:hypothetical protein KCP73_08395 [Salmonella enterica subsp. enterica]|nr:hypothetical protein KCP73_08395 [Salmonella enterica subsp. enterica]